jgi:hypothetical protein
MDNEILPAIDLLPVQQFQIWIGSFQIIGPFLKKELFCTMVIQFNEIKNLLKHVSWKLSRTKKPWKQLQISFSFTKFKQILVTGADLDSFTQWMEFKNAIIIEYNTWLMFIMA